MNRTFPDRTGISYISYSAHLANIDSQISRALVQANDHVTVDVILCRYHHDAAALSPSDAEWGCDAIFMRNQGPFVSGFDVTFTQWKKLVWESDDFVEFDKKKRLVSSKTKTCRQELQKPLRRPLRPQTPTGGGKQKGIIGVMTYFLTIYF